MQLPKPSTVSYLKIAWTDKHALMLTGSLFFYYPISYCWKRKFGQATLLCSTL